MLFPLDYKNTFISLIACMSFCSLLAQQHTLILQPDSLCGKDAILHGLESERNVNYGSNPQFLAASWTFQGIPGNVASIMEFDLSQLPADASIINAELYLYAWPYTTGSGQHSSLSYSNIGWLRRITSNWNESTVTWNTQPSNTTQNQLVVPESTDPNENYILNVTQLVQDMWNDPSNSFGFLLMEQIPDYYCRLNFCSSDFPDLNKHPKLVINYTSNLPISENPGIYIGPDFSICPGESHLLSVPPGTENYTWQDGSTSPTYTVTEPGVYWLHAFNCNSVISDTVIVTADCESTPESPTPEFSNPEFPNIFTPDGDNINDFFTPVKSNGTTTIHLSIVNRWGNLIFEATSLKPVWDGKVNGIPASEGVYFWIAEYPDHSGQTIQVSGPLNLFR